MDGYNAHEHNWYNLDIAHITQSIILNFSEEEIFTTYDMLLTPGIHQLTVNNVCMGRAILKLFLDSLNFHEHMYWLSDADVPSGVISLYQEMALAGCMQGTHKENYRTYLSHEPSMHMIVIECTQGLIQAPWYHYFEQALMDEAVHDYLPIIKVQYA